jgi:STE24 endopeptidase
MNATAAVAPLLWTLVFCTLLVGGLLTRFWLATRQIRHVAQHAHQVPAAFEGTISADAHHKAARYTVAKTRYGLLEAAWGAALLLGWTLLGGLQALDQLVSLWVPPGLWQQVLMLLGFTAIGALLDLPWSAYNTFRLEAQFGFNRTTPRLWLIDGLKGLVLGAALGIPLAAAVLWLMAAAGPLWWLWTWGLWMGFTALMLVVFPTWIAPWFNRFEPLQDQSLKHRVETLMARCGFKAQGLFVMDGSRRSAHANAYFTGFGPAKRVVFFDTLLARLTPDEIEAVLAHELGHFHHRHVLRRVWVMAATSLAGLALLGWLSGQTWFYLGLGVTPHMDQPNHAMALILFMLVVPLGTFFLTPLSSASSRRHEFQADAYACEHAQGQALRSALLKLYEDNASTLTPDPWFVRFYHSHPPANQRLARLAT